MGDSLVPRDGVVIPASDVARRLASAFAYISVDEAKGLQMAHDRADWIESARPAIFLGKHAAMLEFAKRLRRLPVGEALFIEFGDSQQDSVRILVLPEEQIQFGYRDNEDRVLKRPLVERCAVSLDCDIVGF